MFLQNLRKGSPHGFNGPSVLDFFGTAGIRAYWPLSHEEFTRDLSHGGSTLTKYNNPYLKGGVCGGVRWRNPVVAFTGADTSSNFLQASGTSPAAVTNTPYCSMSFWTYVGTPPNSTAAFYEELSDSWGTPHFQALYTTGGAVQAGVRTTAYTSYNTSAYTLTPYQWHHIVVTWAGSGYGDRLRLFVDGRYIYYTLTSGAYVENYTSVMINIGGRKMSNSNDTNTRAINGYMAELAIFNYELPLRTISDYYRFGISQMHPPKVTKYFPSHFVAPPLSLRQRVSRPLQKLYDPRMSFVGKARSDFYLPLENSSLASYGKTYAPGTGSGLTYTSCPLGGGAVTLAGNSGSYVSLGTSTVTLDLSMTISFWMRWDSLTTGESLTSGWEHTNHIFSTNWTGTGTLFIFMYNNPGYATYPDRIRVGCYQVSGSIWRTNISPVINAEVGKWYHFAVYIDQTNNNNIRWYKNGELMGDNTNAGGDWSSFASPTGEFRIGWGNHNGSYPSSVAGAIREFQLAKKYTHPAAVREYYRTRIAAPEFQIPAIYTTKDLVRQRSILLNRNKSQFVVKGDIRQSV